MLESTSIGSRCTIGKQCEIAGCVLFDDCKVGSRTLIKNCILGRGVVIGSDCVLENCVFGEGTEVFSGVTLKQIRVHSYLSLFVKNVAMRWNLKMMTARSLLGHLLILSKHRAKVRAFYSIHDVLAAVRLAFHL